MKGKKFLGGYVDFGFLGRREIFAFKNEKREEESQPAFRLFVRDRDQWRECGALWVRETKEEEDELKVEELEVLGP